MENLIDITDFGQVPDHASSHSPPPSATSSRFSIWQLLTPTPKPSASSAAHPEPITSPEDIPLPQTPAPRDGHGRTPSLSSTSASDVLKSPRTSLNAKAAPFQQHHALPTLPITSLTIKRSKSPPSFFSEPTPRKATNNSTRPIVTSPTARGQWWTTASDGGVRPAENETRDSPPTSPLRYGVEDSWGDGGGYEGRKDGLLLTGMKTEFAFPERKKVVIRSAEEGKGRVIPGTGKSTEGMGDRGASVGEEDVERKDGGLLALKMTDAINTSLPVKEHDVPKRKIEETAIGEGIPTTSAALESDDSDPRGAIDTVDPSLPPPIISRKRTLSRVTDSSNESPSIVVLDLVRALSSVSLSTALHDDNVEEEVCAEGEGIRAGSLIISRPFSPIGNSPIISKPDTTLTDVESEESDMQMGIAPRTMDEEGKASMQAASDESRTKKEDEVKKGYEAAEDLRETQGNDALPEREVIHPTSTTPIRLTNMGSAENPVSVDNTPPRPPAITLHPDANTTQLVKGSEANVDIVRDSKEDLIADLEEQVQQLKDAHTVFISGFDENMYRLKSGLSIGATSAENHTTPDRLLQAKVSALTSKLEAAKTSHEVDKARLLESEEMYREMRERLSAVEADKARYMAKYEGLEDEIKTITGDREKVWDDLQLSEKRRKTLVEKYIQLEDEHKEVISKGDKQTTNGDGVALVLIEGEGRLFDPEMVRKGYDGGKETINIVEDKIDQVCALWLDNAKPGFIQIMLFLDIPEVSRALISAGVIDRGAVFRDFLDGIQEAHPLVAVVDVGGKYGASAKIKDLLKIHVQSSLCRKVFIAASSSLQYEKCLESLRKDGYIDKLHAIRSAHAKSGEIEPFEQLGQDRLVPIESLFSVTPAEWQGMVRSTAGIKANQPPITKEAVPMEESTPSGYTVGLPTVSRPVSPPRSRKPSHSVNPSISSQARSSAATQEADLYKVILPSSPPFEVKPPPWATYRGPTPQALGSPANIARTTTKPRSTPSIVSSSGSLLDQFYESRASSPSVELDFDIESTPSTPKARRHLALEPTPRNLRLGTGPGIVVPIDPSIDGSVGGSPPESDEDEPSVTLPHSAMKITQRPVSFIEDDDRSSVAGSILTMGSSVTRKTSGGGGRSPWAERKNETYEDRVAGGSEKSGFHSDNWVRGKDTAPMGWGTGGRGAITKKESFNANDIPLGSRISGRRGPETQGFKKYEPTPRLTPGSRRETPEYQKLRAFNPPPCHSLYIRGSCDNRSCTFGHSYEISGKEREMLRLLAKEMNCKRVNWRACERDEEDCLYSHKCPQGRFCTYRARCWFGDDPEAHD